MFSRSHFHVDFVSKCGSESFPKCVVVLRTFTCTLTGHGSSTYVSSSSGQASLGQVSFTETISMGTHLYCPTRHTSSPSSFGRSRVGSGSERCCAAQSQVNFPFLLHSFLNILRTFPALGMHTLNDLNFRALN